MSVIESFLNGRAALCCGDSWHFLKDQPDNRYDSVVTDPPYALVSISKRLGAPNAAPIIDKGSGAYKRAGRGFMGKTWDTGETAHAIEFWQEVLRVLKPGGYVIAFGGTRTSYKMAMAMDLAGFEMRDFILEIVDPKSQVAMFIGSLNDEQRAAFFRCLDDSQFGVGL